MIVIFTFLYFYFLYLVVCNLHKKAIQKSEALLKSKYDKEGEAGMASRKLMQEAGYNV